MNLIAAVDQNWAIGNKGELLVQIPTDQKFFRDMTKGKVIVLGRKTLITFPGKLPLAQRTNIILSSNQEVSVRNGIVVHSMEEALEELENYQKEDIYIVGGERIYRQFLPYCKTAYITKIDYAYEADCYMPNLDREKGWKLVDKSEEQTYFDLEYYFCRYERS